MHGLRVNADTYEDFSEAKEKIVGDTEEVKAKKARQRLNDASRNVMNDEILKNSLCASTKGRGTPSSSSRGNESEEDNSLLILQTKWP
ncbi:NADH-quinone oxidoreductase subunit C [Sesbania bispinosa]|nr:NADH-quinone oxidoreductase subunit C [Sesbania bispinosa]